jgi:hypothetical protein
MPELNVNLFDLDNDYKLMFSSYNLILYKTSTKEPDPIGYLNTGIGVIKFLRTKGVELSQEAKEKLLRLKTSFKDGLLHVDKNSYSSEK